MLDEPYRIDPHHLPYDTVGALTNHILNFVLIGDIERDLPGPSYWGVLLSHSFWFARLCEKLSLMATVSIQDPGKESKKRTKAIHGSKRGTRDGIEKFKKQERRQVHELGIRNRSKSRGGRKLTDPSSTTTTARTKASKEKLGLEIGKSLLSFALHRNWIVVFKCTNSRVWLWRGCRDGRTKLRGKMTGTGSRPRPGWESCERLGVRSRY